MDIRFLAWKGYQLAPCTGEGYDYIYGIWDGTGVDDTEDDWDRSGYGSETAAAKHTGTYGLDASGFSAGKKIVFTALPYTFIDLHNYDFLRFWINIKHWSFSKDVFITFFTDTEQSISIELSKYVYETKNDVWQKALIPVEDFGFSTSDSVYIQKLRFEPNGEVGFWLDDVDLAVGITEVQSVAVCPPTVTTEIQARKNVHVDVVIPSTRAKESGVVADQNISAKELKPNVKGSGPSRPKPFPSPINI